MILSQRSAVTVLAGALAAASMAAGAASAAETRGSETPGAETRGAEAPGAKTHRVEGGISYAGYGEVLAARVDSSGMVDYRGLAAGRRKLDRFVVRLGRVDPKAFAAWPKDDKLAFWINAYNALTLKAVLDHYPIKASGLSAYRFPKNSIRQIPGVWSDLRFRVAGRSMTLDEIEHKEVRPKFGDPRAHMALVCASIGCPVLRNEPYSAARIDEQLDDQARRFLADPKKFSIDRRAGRVSLSPIFKWFGKDFVKGFASKKFAGSAAQRASLNFMSRYLAGADRTYLAVGGYKINYLDYDWSLNEQRPGSAKR